MSLEDEDIKIQTIENFNEKLNILINSKYYIDNKELLEEDILKLQNNISLVKRASNL
jgi:hypothetical protein